MILCKNCRDRLGYADVHISSTAESTEDCELCGRLLDEVDEFFEMFREESSNYEFKTFLIGLRASKKSLEEEQKLMAEKGQERRNFKEEFQYQLGTRIEKELGYNADFLNPEIVFTVNQENRDYTLWIKPLFIRGRYLKTRRGIPQSPWIKTGKGEGKSVSEYVGNAVCNAFNGRSYNFFAQGREDVDALMLGTGRPFYVEVENPRKRAADFSLLRNEVFEASSGGVDVSCLETADISEIELMKRQKPDKTYEVGLTIEGDEKNKLEEILSKFSGHKISQRTPLRVLPIRKDKVRERTIRSIEIKEWNDGKLVLLIEAEAGTYIKEFITGDGGRTVPNLKDELEVNVKIDYLNVLEVK